MSFKSHGYATGSNASIKEAARIITERKDRMALGETIRQMQLLLQSAEHLLLASTGPEDAPEPWSEVRARWIEKAKVLNHLNHYFQKSF